MGSLESQRKRAMNAPKMVEHFLQSRGITDSRVLAAMAKVPRHLFVPEALRERAYSDHPLPIGDDQTISQPFMVALMSQALRMSGKERVLEIGTGSGYQTAILAELAKAVYSVERVHRLASSARKKLEEIGYSNVSICVRSGSHGWSEYAPYDRIMITACSPTLPETLPEQLVEGGRLIAPLGLAGAEQKLFLFEKTKGELKRIFLGYCSFVPMIS